MLCVVVVASDISIPPGRQGGGDVCVVVDSHIRLTTEQGQNSPWSQKCRALRTSQEYKKMRVRCVVVPSTSML